MGLVGDQGGSDSGLHEQVLRSRVEPSRSHALEIRVGVLAGDLEHDVDVERRGRVASGVRDGQLERLDRGFPRLSVGDQAP
jgi:hypothetical protein